MLLRPQYKRLQIGTIAGEKETVKALGVGELSKVPYAEPTWLCDGFHSPYYTENHRQFQKAMRKFVMEVIEPEMRLREDDGKRISQSVVDKISEMNIHAMRLGPGKHLKGRTLMGGLVKPEEFDYFHEVCVYIYISRIYFSLSFSLSSPLSMVGWVYEVPWTVSSQGVSLACHQS